MSNHKNPCKVLDLYIRYLIEQKQSTRWLSDDSSYRLKHEVEQLSKYLSQKYPGWQPVYCGEDEFIQAMHDAGFQSRIINGRRYFRMKDVDLRAKLYAWVDKLIKNGELCDI